MLPAAENNPIENELPEIQSLGKNGLYSTRALTGVRYVFRLISVGISPVESAKTQTHDHPKLKAGGLYARLLGTLCTRGRHQVSNRRHTQQLSIRAKTHAAHVRPASTFVHIAS